MRDAILKGFLSKTDFRDCEIDPLAGDASARRYFRLLRDGVSIAILMDDPPDGSHATQRFETIAGMLTTNHFAAPRIFAHELALGAMIIEDLGQIDFAIHLKQNPNDEATLYAAATDLLSSMHHHRFSVTLSEMTATVAAQMINLAALHYAPDAQHEMMLHDAMLRAFDENVNPQLDLSLRDFHAENLIWRPALSGHDRVGLLDFQDACYAPLGYDLMSLLRDARRDVDPVIADQMILRFCKAVGRPFSEMSGHLACVSAQRNLRILGIFARLAQVAGKAKYLAFLPRVWTHLLTDLEHPAMADLKAAVLIALPPPDSETLKRLGAL